MSKHSVSVEHEGQDYFVIKLNGKEREVNYRLGSFIAHIIDGLEKTIEDDED